jgi:two-component system, NarL family, nitrate/nitrite response regulator NarL
MLDANSRPDSSVQDSRDFASIGPQRPRTDLSETFDTSEYCYRLSGSPAAICRTVLLSENGLFRAGLEQMLHKSRISVIGEGHDIASLLDTMTVQPIPELVICHIASGRNDNAALNFIGSLRLHFTEAKLVVLADTCTGSFLSGVSTDVNAVLLTSLSSEMLVQSLELVLLNYRLFPAAILSLRTDTPAQPPLGSTPTESLTMLPMALPSLQQLTAISQRERQVLGCLVRGLSNKCIARELNIVEGTAKVYMKQLSRKLKAGNRTQLAIWAVHHFAQLDTVNVVGTLHEQGTGPICR